MKQPETLLEFIWYVIKIIGLIIFGFFDGLFGLFVTDNIKEVKGDAHKDELVAYMEQLDTSIEILDYNQEKRSGLLKYDIHTLYLLGKTKEGDYIQVSYDMNEKKYQTYYPERYLERIMMDNVYQITNNPFVDYKSYYYLYSDYNWHYDLEDNTTDKLKNEINFKPIKDNVIYMEYDRSFYDDIINLAKKENLTVKEYISSNSDSLIKENIQSINIKLSPNILNEFLHGKNVDEDEVYRTLQDIFEFYKSYKEIYPTIDLVIYTNSRDNSYVIKENTINDMYLTKEELLKEYKIGK